MSLDTILSFKELLLIIDFPCVLFGGLYFLLLDRTMQCKAQKQFALIWKANGNPSDNLNLLLDKGQGELNHLYFHLLLSRVIFWGGLIALMVFLIPSP